MRFLSAHYTAKAAVAEAFSFIIRELALLRK